MCGIAGVLVSRKSENLDFSEALTRLSDALATRGPDASGQWVSGSRILGFAHRRLSIIDVDARSDQPMHSADGRYTIVFNGEIYNYQELRSGLEKKGRGFRTTGDTEVLLQMYAEYGADMLPRLRGMYAFGIWDELAQELFLARDPFGIKPLYYAEGAGNFYFASQVKALVTAPDVDLREEPAGHVGFFVWGSVPEPYTLYRGIHCLPSGTWMRATREGTSKPRLFASPVGEFSQFRLDEMPQSETEADVRLHDALRESVRMHEISDVPVAIFLSAGIDSGVVTALAAETGNEVETLTLGFDLLRDTAEDETQTASRVAQHYGLPHFARYIDRPAFMAHRDRLLEKMDQPTIDGVNTYFISWLARERGFKVALSGLGGDELFGGYPSFRQLPFMVWSLRAASAVPFAGRAWRIMTSAVIRRFTSPKYASLFEYGGTWGGAYLLRRGLFMPWELPQILDPELVRTGWRDLASIESMNGLTRPLAKVPGATAAQTEFLRVSALEMSYYMRTQLLRDADWAGMAHSVEIRVPLVDMTLLRQLAPLRASRFSPRKPKIAACLRKPLPAEVLRRPKSGFGVPVREWMQDSPDRGLRHWATHVYRALYTRGAPVRSKAAAALAR
jgi:asparagine synthase (glutamine-hydrolysing)